MGLRHGIVGKVLKLSVPALFASWPREPSIHRPQIFSHRSCIYTSKRQSRNQHRRPFEIASVGRVIMAQLKDSKNVWESL
jgi:hypothetical protein